jgi:hypothetical protein
MVLVNRDDAWDAPVIALAVLYLPSDYSWRRDAMMKT